MMGRRLLAVFLSSALASPGWAAGKVVRPPSVGTGTAYGIDPYVAEFQDKMNSITQRMAAMQKAIRDIKIPPKSEKGALAAKVAMVAEFAVMATLEAEAMAAEKKIRDHIKSNRNTAGLKYGPGAKSADFGDKNDDSSLKPKDDRTFRGAAHNSGSMPEQARDSVSSHGSGQSAAVAHPTLHSVNAPVGYGGQVGAGFGSQQMVVKAAYGAPPAAERTSDPAPIGLSPGAGSAADGGGGAGMGSAGGSAPGASVGKTEGDSKPGTNPSMDSLSKNSSDVAAKAAAAKEKAAADAKAARDKAEEDEKQRKQQQQQMAMQAAQQAAQAASQAAQNANKNKQEQKGQGGGGGGDQQNFQDAVDRAVKQRMDDFNAGKAAAEKEAKKREEDAKKASDESAAKNKKAAEQNPPAAPPEP